MTRILLIEPPTPEKEFGVMRIIASIGSLKANVKYPPLDLMILGGFLRKNGIDFEILDALALNMSWSDVRREIKKQKPEAVVFTTTVPSMENDVITAKVAKSVDSRIKTIPINIAMGSSRVNYMEKYPFVDFIPYQDFEWPILNLIKSNYNPKNVRGILYREGKKITKNEGGNQCANLDDLGIPAHDKIDLKLYSDHIARRSPLTLVITSRGCKNQCHHCMARYVNPLRVRSIDSVMEELHFVKSLGIKEIVFWDCELPPSAALGEKFFKRMIKEDFGFSWACNARSDCITLKVLRLMKQAGCHTVKLGADSNSQTILNNMNKNETVREVEQAAANIRKAGMRLMTYCTLGHKGETKETMINTINWITDKMRPDITTFSIAIPVYGTVFYNYLEKNGYLNKNLSDTNYDPSFEPPYSYVGRMEKEGLPDLTGKEIYEIAKWGYRRFYLRPSYMVKRALTTNSLAGDLNRLAYFLKMYLK
ncbi:MAG: radical SAM protein [Candidatus Aenigmatarchaeota archaeon]